MPGDEVARGHEVLAADEREPGERADERDDGGDDEDLVQRTGEAGVERVDEALALVGRHGVQDPAHVARGQRRGDAAAAARYGPQCVNRLGRYRVLEDRAERG